MKMFRAIDEGSKGIVLSLNIGLEAISLYTYSVIDGISKFTARAALLLHFDLRASTFPPVVVAEN